MVANDNNYPFVAGRHHGVADGNEWIIVRPARNFQSSRPRSRR